MNRERRGRRERVEGTGQEGREIMWAMEERGK